MLLGLVNQPVVIPSITLATKTLQHLPATTSLMFTNDVTCHCGLNLHRQAVTQCRRLSSPTSTCISRHRSGGLDQAPSRLLQSGLVTNSPGSCRCSWTLR